MYFEALDKDGEIFRFNARTISLAIQIAYETHCKSLVKINIRTLTITGTILPWKQEGYSEIKK